MHWAQRWWCCSYKLSLPRSHRRAEGDKLLFTQKAFSFSIQKQPPSVIYFEFSCITHCLSLLCRLGERWLYTSLTQILRSDIGKELHCILRLSVLPYIPELVKYLDLEATTWHWALSTHQWVYKLCRGCLLPAPAKPDFNLLPPNQWQCDKCRWLSDKFNKL